MRIDMNHKVAIPAPTGALNIDEAANYLRVSRASLFRLFKAKKLRRTKLGDRTVVRLKDLEDLLDRSAA
jgi:excisionase family DNA binding protein